MNSTEKCLTSRSIYIFQGGKEYEGISYESFNGLKRNIKKISPPFSIQDWNNEVLPENWDKMGLCVLPGGECSKWNRMLSSDLQKQLLEWIENGGRVLAVCAGGYFCSEKSRFLLETNIWIESRRIINIFSGICQGPFFSHNVEVVKVRWEKTQEVGYAAVIKGGEFIQDQGSEKECQVLAKFVDKVEAVAVIKCAKGKGCAILSSIHWEFGCKDIRPIAKFCPQLSQKLHLLKDSKKFRKRCFAEMLSLLS